MKKNYLLIALIFAFLALITMNGCDSSSGPTYFLDAPILNGSFTATFNQLDWSQHEVAGADYYVLYGLAFQYDGIEGPDNPSPIPREGKLLTEIIYKGTALEHKHITTEDYAYAVVAWTNDGKYSDYSAIAFTEEWVHLP